MNRRTLLVSVGAAGCLLACGSPKTDFARFCRVSVEVIADPAVARADRPRVIVERFREQRMSGKTRNCIEAVYGKPNSPSGLNPDIAYSALERCAREAGADGWSCPSLKQHYETPGAPVVVE